MNRDDLSLEQLAQVLDVPADMAALMMRGTISKGRPMPEAPQRYRVEERHEVVPIDRRPLRRPAPPYRLWRRAEGS